MDELSAFLGKYIFLTYSLIKIIIKVKGRFVKLIEFFHWVNPGKSGDVLISETYIS